ncbi:hypothetical protein AB5J62_33065 [Amycolatopsis sp. cg5]|uniref:hypothetical protein n=1 Tax=Amycolatopsis sp. cg5 TaxID=3238802 RepID=UPI003526601B
MSLHYVLECGHQQALPTIRQMLADLSALPCSAWCECCDTRRVVIELADPLDETTTIPRQRVG